MHGFDYQNQLALDTLIELHNYVPIDARQTDVWFVTTPEAQQRACKGFAACAVPQTEGGWYIYTYWPETWKKNHALLLAHELCHVFYNGDENHTHNECFGRPDVTGPAAYGGGEGYAYQTAITITEEFNVQQ